MDVLPDEAHLWVLEELTQRRRQRHLRLHAEEHGASARRKLDQTDRVALAALEGGLG